MSEFDRGRTTFGQAAKKCYDPQSLHYIGERDSGFLRPDVISYYRRVFPLLHHGDRPRRGSETFEIPAEFRGEKRSVMFPSQFRTRMVHQFRDLEKIHSGLHEPRPESPTERMSGEIGISSLTRRLFEPMRNVRDRVDLSEDWSLVLWAHSGNHIEEV